MTLWSNSDQITPVDCCWPNTKGAFWTHSHTSVRRTLVKRKTPWQKRVRIRTRKRVKPISRKTCFPLFCHQFAWQHAHTHTQKNMAWTKPIVCSNTESRSTTFVSRICLKPKSKLGHSYWSVLRTGKFRNFKQRKKSKVQLWDRKCPKKCAITL